jgi:hypothetical protein
MRKPTMSNATDQARSTRSDARAFADAFAAADDAFTFGSTAGESREVTLDELGDVIALDRPSERAAGRFGTREARPAAPAHVSSTGDDDLLTLDELGDALLRPARPAEDLDFDFGSSADERARRRTAARFDASPAARRRISGPSTSTTRPSRAAVRLTEVDDPRPTDPGTSADGRAAMADAAASAAERLAEPAGASRFARERPTALRLDAGPATTTAPRLREVEARPARQPRAASDLLGANPDRIAMWAVLLGILLVLIAFTSGSASAVALPLLSAL